MKWAKSVKVKKRARASGSCGTGLSGCRPASSATIRGEADPTWCTCSSALGRPATKVVEVGARRGVGAHGGPVCRMPRRRPARRNPVARGSRAPVGRSHDPTRALAAPHRAARAAPTRPRPTSTRCWPGATTRTSTGGCCTPRSTRRRTGSCGRPGPTTRSTTPSSRVADGAVVGTLSVDGRRRDGPGPGLAGARERGAARLPARPGAPRPRLRDRDGACGARPGLRRPGPAPRHRRAASPTTSPRGG